MCGLTRKVKSGDRRLDEEGEIRGQAIEPLHQNVPKAARKDELLYKLLASIDILRVGNVREQKKAIDELKKAIL